MAMAKARQWNWYRECPHCGGIARVRDTEGRVRYLVCRECGRGFKRVFRVLRPRPRPLRPRRSPAMGPATRRIASARPMVTGRPPLAADCPECHAAAARVYRTLGRVRQMRCRACGHRYELVFRSAKLRPPGSS